MSEAGKITVENSRTQTVSASDYHERVLALLTHIENVVDDESWQRIDVKLWNDVSLTEPEIVYSE